MANDEHNLSHKFRVLNIRRRNCRNERAHLLGLPQELRNVIYEMVLVELPVHLRAHNPGCPRISILHGAETPICKSSLEEFERGEYAIAGRDSLLRVNKQIHRETLPIFLGTNTFCFVSVDAFNSTFPNLSSSTRTTICRIWIAHDYTNASRTSRECHRIPSSARDEAVNGICHFNNLIELSLPSRLLPGLTNCRDNRPLDMKSLRALRVNVLAWAGNWPEDRHLAEAEEVPYMLLEKAISLANCFADGGHPGTKTRSPCRTRLLDSLRHLSEGFCHGLGWSSRGDSLAEQNWLRVLTSLPR